MFTWTHFVHEDRSPVMWRWWMWFLFTTDKQGSWRYDLRNPYPTVVKGTSTLGDTWRTLLPQTRANEIQIRNGRLCSFNHHKEMKHDSPLVRASPEIHKEVKTPNIGIGSKQKLSKSQVYAMYSKTESHQHSCRPAYTPISTNWQD